MTPEDIQAMFANIRENTDWDLQGPLVWGFFFTDAAEAPLRGLQARLESEGYRFVNLYMQEPDEGEPFHVLHVEKIEVLDEAALEQRNLALEALAVETGVEDYDGMDVGPVMEPVTRH